MKKLNIAAVVLLVLGVVLIVLGSVLIPVFHNMINNKINQAIPLKNGTDSFKYWQDPPATVYMQFYMWDVQNPDEIINHGKKPVMEQRGPYTYREVRVKQDIEFADNGSMLYYVEPKAYVFEESLSVGPEDDTFTNVNLPVVVMATTFQYSAGFMQDALAFLLTGLGEGLFTKHTVGEYLWGYEEPNLKKLNEFTKKWLNKTYFSDEVGLFVGATGNGTNDGQYGIWTGTSDINKIGIIDTWLGNSTLHFWNTPYCNMINGTDGSFWHPNVKKSERLMIFTSDICRSIYVDYASSSSVKDIDVLQFEPPKSVFADPIENPDNVGYCTPDCLKAGVLNVTVCKNAPIIMSQPHFYQGAPEYIDAIVGMKPTKQEHGTYINVEPLSGAALNVSKKLQMNVHLKKMKACRDTSNLNDTIFPIMWLNESAVISDDAASKFRNEVLRPISLTQWIQYGLIVLGAVLVYCALGLFVYQRCTRSPNADVVLKAPVDADDSESRALLDSQHSGNNYHSSADHQANQSG